jgi:CubicO group peptidase (beta-lactamase class C family)
MQSFPARFQRLRMLSALFVMLWSFPLLATDLPSAKPEDVGLSTERLARIDRAIEASISQRRIAGAVAIIARHGKVAYHKAFGMADIEARRPMRTDDMFRLYSMTKPVISVALLTLYEEGKFQLTDPLDKFIPGFGNAKVFVGMDENGRMVLEEPRRKPTVQDAFRHTPGLVSGLGPGPVNERYRELGLVMEKIQSVRQEVETLATIPLEFHPGERWNYGLAHDVQAYLVEHFSGMPLDRYLKERLFNPLGMKETGYGIPRSLAPRFANNYEPSPEGELEVRESATTGLYTRFNKIPLGTVGLSSTAMDYIRFAQMLLNGGELNGVRVLGKKTVELLRQNHLPETVKATASEYAPNASGYGLGFSVTLSAAAEGNLGSAGAFGWSGAATTKFYIDPAEDMVAVFFAQRWPFDALLLNEFQTLLYQSIVH